MAYPDLPNNVKSMAASQAMRWRHRYWHLVKNEDFIKDPPNKNIVAALAKIGWTAALTGESGAGLDFLYMHRTMIANIDKMLVSAKDPNWPKVIGWSEIPVDADDPNWPEPSIKNIDNPDAWPKEKRRSIRGIAEARSSSIVKRNIKLAAQLRDPEVLKQKHMTLDRYGHVIEVTVHNWMHMRFADAPRDNSEDLDVSNDWLGAPFSSHVNPYFWKLHGWIDDCIGEWEKANDKVADFSSAWRPPESAPPFSELSIEPETMATTEKHIREVGISDLNLFVTPPETLDKAMSMITDK